MTARRPSVAGGRLLGPCLIAGLLLMAGGSWITAAEPADAPLPEITGQDLAEKMRAAWAHHASALLEIEFQEERSDPLLGMHRIGKFTGKFRYVGDGRRWRVDYDSTTKAGAPGKRWSSGLSDLQKFSWDQRTRNVVILGATTNEARTYFPGELFCNEGGSLLNSLTKPNTTISQRTVDGRRCYQVVASNGQYSRETAISPSQGYLPVRQSWFVDGLMYSAYNLRDLREASPGLWFPGQIFSLARRGDTAHRAEPTLLARRFARVVRFEPVGALDDGAFRLEVPYGTDVTDVCLGYSYRNDPWWPEVEQFLRERSGWPRADLSLFQTLKSESYAKLEGEAAPPIRAAAWLDGPRLDWDRLRGKFTLVEFWDSESPSCGPEMPALRRLYENYRPAGFEIVAIHAPTDDLEGVRRFAREYRVPFPIVLDEKSGSSGATARAFGVKAVPCVFLVDREGKVRKLPRQSRDGRALVNALEEVLRDSHRGELVPRLNHDTTLPRPMYDALRTHFRALTAAAPASGRIQGVIVDEARRPIAGARVSAKLAFGVLVYGRPGAVMTISGPQAEATTGPDGRFELAGLCKGRYDLAYRAAGRTIFDDTVTIAPDLAPVTADAILEQGGSIEGIVFDDEGNPVEGASIAPAQMRPATPRGNVVNSSARNVIVRTDANGRFRLSQLQVGEYHLRVTAPGFEPQSLGWIRNGSAGLSVDLKRSRAK